ncbi:MAG TPA: hypothetical protein VGK47_07230 [Nitrososphaeraceae archaeon]
MKTITFKLPTIDEVDFSIEATEDDIPVRGNAIDTGNKAEDKKIEDKILARLRAGNVWAWCCVKVSASFKGIESDPEYLGACSYKSEKDFKKGLYYADMRQTAYDNLISKLQSFEQ